MDILARWVEPVRRGRGAPVTPDMMRMLRPRAFEVSIIWFDQGGATGWAAFSILGEALYNPKVKILSNITAWSAGEFNGTETDMTDQMMELITAWPDDTYVGYEDFILRKFTMGRELLSPVRLGARLEDRMYMAGRLPQLQTPQQPSMAKTKVDDDRMKRWGFWKPLAGQKNARDAVRHVITFASGLKDRNLKRRPR